MLMSSDNPHLEVAYSTLYTMVGERVYSWSRMPFELRDIPDALGGVGGYYCME